MNEYQGSQYDMDEYNEWLEEENERLAEQFDSQD